MTSNSLCMSAKLCGIFWDINTSYRLFPVPGSFFTFHIHSQSHENLLLMFSEKHTNIEWLMIDRSRSSRKNKEVFQQIFTRTRS